MTENEGATTPKPITLRLPASLDRMVRNAAATDHRSLNSQLIVLLELGMRAIQRPAGSPPITLDQARGLERDPIAEAGIDPDAPPGRGLAGLIPTTPKDV